jgi:hypothetical protein
MDIFDLYPINNNNDDFIILDALRKLLRKKKKSKNKKHYIEKKISINNEDNIEELLWKVKIMKSIGDVDILREFILIYTPKCINELNEYNKILMDLGPILGIPVDDILIYTDAIKKKIKLDLESSSSVKKLRGIISVMEQNLIALIENYTLLNGEKLNE